MNFWVGVTDNKWYEFLAQLQPEEVNFWQPSGTPTFKKKIELFLFKLHSPLDYITGGGYFVTYTNLPVSLVWDTFREKNGVSNKTELRKIILEYRKSHGRFGHPDPEIGCNILAQPFFFGRDKWIPIPDNWKRNIVRGKMYSTQTDVGRKLLSDVKLRLNHLEISLPEKTFSSTRTDSVSERYGTLYQTRARIGQGSFRVLVTDAYKRRCAMSGEKTLPVLEAAHSRAYSEQGPHETSNGLLLRADLHRLFDKHYLTITPDFKIEVSKRIHEEYENGKDYYKLHGRDLAVLPDHSYELPSREHIEWHNQRFLG